MVDLPGPLSKLLRDFTAAEQPPAGSLADHVRQHLSEMRAAARHNEMLPLDLAEAIAKGLLTLLESPGLSEEHAKLVRGAARYFVSNDDERPDFAGPLGLDDDVLVFNHVASRLGRDDLEVEP